MNYLTILIIFVIIEIIFAIFHIIIKTNIIKIFFQFQSIDKTQSV